MSHSFIMASSITFLRHAESEFNIDPLSTTRDCGLTPHGQTTAAQLTGHYQLIICSPLKRAIETLHYSQLTYDNIVFEPLTREHKVDSCDFFDHEEIVIESDEELTTRGDLFLQRYRSYHILVISHCEFIANITSYSLDNLQTTCIKN